MSSFVNFFGGESDFERRLNARGTRLLRALEDIESAEMSMRDHMEAQQGEMGARFSVKHAAGKLAHAHWLLQHYLGKGARRFLKFDDGYF